MARENKSTSIQEQTVVIRAIAAPPIVEIARNLRQWETSAEDMFWESLRNRRLNYLKVRRQQPVANAIYGVDFSVMTRC